MNVNPVNPLQAPKIGSQSAPRVDDQQPANEVQARERRDTLELSNEAQDIRENQRNESLAQIQSQINAGYFNRPEVIRETAVQINKELNSEIRRATS